jgi:hypothetical protein
VDRRAEVRHLEMADRHIATAEKNVAAQRMQLSKLQQGGHDVELAEKSLRALEDTLETMRAHRALIIQTIEQIDRGLI